MYEMAYLDHRSISKRLRMFHGFKQERSEYRYLHSVYVCVTNFAKRLDMEINLSTK